MLGSGTHLAFLIDSAGFGEWLILFVVILIVVGPKRLPEAARKFGRMMTVFRRAADEFKNQIMTMDQPPPQPYDPPPTPEDYSTDGSSDPYAYDSQMEGSVPADRAEQDPSAYPPSDSESVGEGVDGADGGASATALSTSTEPSADAGAAESVTEAEQETQK